MRFNIFRNPFIDAQVTMFIDTFDEAIRKQTESYWRNEIAKELEERCTDNPSCDNCKTNADYIRNNETTSNNLF